MSLFSGIKFSSDTAKSLAAESAAAVAAADGTSPVTSSTSAPSTTDAPGAAGPSSAPKPSTSKSTAPLAALQFAPRAKTNKPKATQPPQRGFATSGSSYWAPSTVTSAAVLEAAPVLINASSSSSSLSREVEVVMGTDGEPIVRAPAMTLAAAEKEKGDGKRKADSQKKKKKKKKRRQQVVHTFQPDEEYDPNTPNDLGEYQHYRRRLREEKRAAADANRGSDDSSYYSDSSVEAPRRDAPKAFAPPKTLYSPGQVRARLPSPPAVRPRQPSPPPDSGADAYAQRVAMTVASTGDDAYARRQALSQAASGDDAYARRAVMSQAATGDDAFARRAAMSVRPPEPAYHVPPPRPSFHPATHGVPSLGPPPPGPPPPSLPQPSLPPAGTPGGFPTFRPPPAHLLAGAPPPVPSGPPPFRPPPAHLMAGAPLPPPVGHASPHPAAPVEPPTPHPHRYSAPSPPRTDPEYERQLDEKKRAAAAVAAKLAALVGTPKPAPQPVADEDQSGTFAERMMRRWGHTEGAGLGVREDGIKVALAAEHVAKPMDTSKLSKRQRAKQRAAAANAKNRKWTQAANSRGRIVNANEEERQREEHDKFGEASRIICIMGMDDDDAGEELSDEIGEECSRHGIVERVVLHMVEPAPEDATDALRVFVVFSGMAGAWRATRELEGRFFGGKKLSVRYFDEALFDRGERDGPL